MSLTEACQAIGRAMLRDRSDSGASASGGPRTASEILDDGAASRAGETAPAVTGAKLGDITLRPHQLDAVQRVAEALFLHGGALLADTVGLGKTFVALAVAREFSNVDVLAPAALLPMWRSAFQSTGIDHATLRSLHGFSRSPNPAPIPDAGKRLVIIDEAHYLRTRNTIRFHRVADFCINAQILLISATPLHNRPRELRNLLSLFLGARADALDAEMLAGCVVRRSSAHVTLPLPAVREHPPLKIPANLPVLEAILTVAPPLPTHDGAAAGALVRLGLLRAWCSSDAALTDTVRRRQLRGEALLHSLTHGRYPTQRELQSWIVGHDSVQLGFPELLVQSANSECAPLLATLTAHLDSLNTLLQQHTRSSHADATRVAYLRSLLGDLHIEGTQHDVKQLDGLGASEGLRAASKATPVIAFSQFATTVRALHRALGDIAGVASLTAAGGRIASGTLPREQIIARFSPVSNGKPPPPSHEQIRLLLTTDLLAEGVNLQDAGTIVHLDLPWTDALRQQRVGRLVRMQSRHRTVEVHTFAPPVGTERALAIAAVLERKAGFHREWIGNDSRLSHVRDAESAAEASTATRRILQSWVSRGAQSIDRHDGYAEPLVASIPSNSHAFVAVIARGRALSLISHRIAPADVLPGTQSETSGPCFRELLPSTDVRDVLPFLREIDTHSRCSPTHEFTMAHAALEQLARHAQTQIDRLEAISAAELVSGPTSRGVSPLQERALRVLAARVANAPAIMRSLHRHEIRRAEDGIKAARGAGAEQRLAAWLEGGASDQQLSGWLATVPAFTTAASDTHRPSHGAAGDDTRVLAVIMLVAARQPIGT